LLPPDRIVGFVPGPQLFADGAMLRLPCRHLLEPDDRLDSSIWQKNSGGFVSPERQ
jgi:hypothetical protein